MDLGRKDLDSPGYIKYSSEVYDYSEETITRFNERVHAWVGRAGIRLGEGTTKILDHIGEGYVIYLRAPLAEGSWEDIDPDVTFPLDETCMNGSTLLTFGDYHE